jgi:hypothetical protein
MPSPVPLGAWVIDYVGQHWLLECLTKHLIFKREEDRSAITLITRRMQKLLKCTAREQTACEASVGLTEWSEKPYFVFIVVTKQAVKDKLKFSVNHLKTQELMNSWVFLFLFIKLAYNE